MHFYYLLVKSTSPEVAEHIELTSVTRTNSKANRKIALFVFFACCTLFLPHRMQVRTLARSLGAHTIHVHITYVQRDVNKIHAHYCQVDMYVYVYLHSSWLARLLSVVSQHTTAAAAALLRCVFQLVFAETTCLV